MPVGHYDRTKIPRKGRPGFSRGIFGDISRDWMQNARCAQLLAEATSADERRRLGAIVDQIFFPLATGRSHEARSVYQRRVTEARAICHTCPVLAACEQYRRAIDDQNGVWGGVGELERETRDARNELIRNGRTYA